MRGDNVFYTGSAGCGKSTVLHEIRRHFRAVGQIVTVLAPTGLAALNVNGQTTWSYAGWQPGAHKRKLKELEEDARIFTHQRNRLILTDVLIIDEISMVENHHLERLNCIMKSARQSSEAFGGAQVIITGDFCQLPPVKPFEHCMICGKDMHESHGDSGKLYSCDKCHLTHPEQDQWAFRSKAWEECNFKHIHLKEIHRQTEGTFVSILQKIRAGHRLEPNEIQVLLGVDRKPLSGNATKLFAVREQAREENDARFNMLRTECHGYWCLDQFTLRDHHPGLAPKGNPEPDGPKGQHPLIALRDHRFQSFVRLKQGMLVILLSNFYREEGLCNGSQGVIAGFEAYDPAQLPKYKVYDDKKDKKGEPERKSNPWAAMQNEQCRRFMEGPGAKDKVWPVVKFHNGVTRTIFADCSITELGHPAPFSTLSRTQIPLVAGWAMTIHKSQSLTMDRVIVDITRVWEEGQVYVALSRASSLQGLTIVGSMENLQSAVGGNFEVQQFLREKFGAASGFSAAAAESLTSESEVEEDETDEEIGE